MNEEKKRFKRKLKRHLRKAKLKIHNRQIRNAIDSQKQLADQAAELMEDSYKSAGKIDALIKRAKKHRRKLKRQRRFHEANEVNLLISMLSKMFAEARNMKNSYLEQTRSLNKNPSLRYRRK